MFKKLIKKAFHFGFEKSYSISYDLSAKLVGFIMRDPMVDLALHRMKHVAEDKGISAFDLSVNQFCWAIDGLLRNKEIVKRIPDEIIWNHRLMMRLYTRSKMYELYLKEVAAEFIGMQEHRAPESPLEAN